MEMQRVRNLNWLSALFRDVSAAELAAEDDGNLFAEEADIAAQIEVLGLGGINPPIVRYSYRMPRGLPAVGASGKTPVPWLWRPGRGDQGNHAASDQTARAAA